MNQYRCETCKNIDCDCNPITQKGYFIPLLDIRKFTAIKGCASHSDFNPQAEREKVLDKLDKWADSLPPYSGKDIPKVMLKGKIEELRQDGEQG